MATSTFNFPCFSGQVVTLRLYTLSTATEVFQGTATELEGSDGELLGRYSVDIVDIATGSYDWVAYNAGDEPLNSGILDHNNSTGTERDRHESVIPLDAAAIRTALGMASANLDTQLGEIAAKTVNLPSDPADQSQIETALDGFATSINDTVVNEIADLATNMATAANLAVVDSVVDGIAAKVVGTIAAGTHNPQSGDSYAVVTNATYGLEAIRNRGDAAWITGSGGSGGSGSGARSVTITVNDGSTLLEGAKVRLSQGVETYVVTTNASGIATFSLDDATWAVTITKPGYSFTPTTLVVDGTETPTYSMTAVSIPAASDPSLTTGYIYCYGIDGEVEEGITLYVSLVSGTGTDGRSLDTGEASFVSDDTGLASYTFIRNATYKIRRGKSRPIQFIAPNVSSFSISELLGSP